MSPPSSAERTNERIPQAGWQAAWKKRGPNLFSSVCRCPPFLSLSLVLSLTGKKGQVVLLYRYTVLVVGKRTIGFRSKYAFPVSLGPRLQKYIVRPECVSGKREFVSRVMFISASGYILLLPIWPNSETIFSVLPPPRHCRPGLLL